MLVPKDVLLELIRAPIPGVSSRVLNEVIRNRYILSAPAEFEKPLARVWQFAISRDGLSYHSIAAWRSFVTYLNMLCYQVHARISLIKGAAAGDHGEVMESTNNYQMLHHMAILYHLHSWGVQGDVMECGSFKGVSAAFLSWGCKLLDRRLYVCDSFAGLPDIMSADEKKGYRPGSYAGSLNEVRRTIRTFGCLDVCTFVKGYFEETLPYLNTNLALLWADVDLEYSMDGVLNHQHRNLQREGVFISDEIFARNIDENGEIRADAESVPRSVRRFFQSSGIPIRCVNFGLGNSVILRDPERVSLYHPTLVTDLLVK